MRKLTIERDNLRREFGEVYGDMVSGELQSFKDIRDRIGVILGEEECTDDDNVDDGVSSEEKGEEDSK